MINLLTLPCPACAVASINNYKLVLVHNGRFVKCLHGLCECIVKLYEQLTELHGVHNLHVILLPGTVFTTNCFYNIYLLNDTGFYARVASECCIERTCEPNHSEVTTRYLLYEFITNISTHLTR